MIFLGIKGLKNPHPIRFLIEQLFFRPRGVQETKIALYI